LITRKYYLFPMARSTSVMFSSSLKPTMPKLSSGLLLLSFCCIEATTLASLPSSYLFRQTWRIHEKFNLTGDQYSLKRQSVCFASHNFISKNQFLWQKYSCDERVKKQMRRNKYDLSVSQSSRDMSNGQSTEKRKKHDNNHGKRARMRKSDLDNLLRGIGLVPVQSSNSKKKRADAKNTQSKKKKPCVKGISYQLPLESRKSSFAIFEAQPTISLETQLKYTQKGHAALRSFLPNDVIQQLRFELIPHAAKHALAAWRQKVEVQLADSSEPYHRQNAWSITNNLDSIEKCHDFLESLGMDPTTDLPFLQYFNTWRTSSSNVPVCPTVTDLCLSQYLAHTASVLMDCSSVRLYQDSLFHKRPGDGWTPWHSDARMAPFDTSKMVTFWIPLQNVPSLEDGGTGLIFVDSSHSDFALPYWNGVDGKEYDRLEGRYDNGSGDDNGGVSDHMPLAIGDITAHSGWTLHCAESATSLEKGQDRYALAITYVDGRAEVREDVLTWNSGNISSSEKGDKEDVWSFKSWVQEVEPRSQFRHSLVPMVWPVDMRE